MNATKDKADIERIIQEREFFENENDSLLKRVQELESIVEHQRGILTHRSATKDYAELFKKVDDNKNYGLIFLDSEYKVVAISETTKKILGYKSEDDLKEIIGKNYTELLIAEEARLEFHNLVAKGKESEGIRQEVGIKKKNGVTYVRSRIVLYLKTRRDETIGLLIRLRKN